MSTRNSALNLLVVSEDAERETMIIPGVQIRHSQVVSMTWRPCDTAQRSQSLGYTLKSISQCYQQR
jgi:hypothetical protein